MKALSKHLLGQTYLQLIHSQSPDTSMAHLFATCMFLSPSTFSNCIVLQRNRAHRIIANV